MALKTPLLVLLASAALGMGNARAAAPATNSPSRPHILLILADELRADCLGACGNRQVRTPYLDALAAEGIRFNNFFCSFPVCTPSRYSLLSGLPVHQHRGWGNHCTLPPGTVTFPALLRQAGYRTKAVGKMHFTPTYADFGLSELELAEQNGPGRWDDDYHRYLRRLGVFDANDLEDQESEFRRNARPEYWKNFGAIPSNLNERDYSTTWIGDRAVETLKQWDPAVPALIMVGFIKPHHPFDPPGTWARQYDWRGVSLLPGWTPAVSAVDLELGKGYFDNTTLTAEGVRRCTANYYATISELDTQIGRMIATLKRNGLYDSTLIVFTADHGEYLGFHHLLLKGNLMYDPLARVPLIIRLPDGHGAASVRDELFSNTDLATTILQAAGVPRAEAMQGQDLLAATAGRDIVFCESGEGYIMARTRTHKLLWRKTPEQRLFFDLATDPLELTNRIHDPQCAGEIDHLTRATETWRPAPVTAAYVDEHAPQVNQPNVASPNQRQNQHRWFREQMKEWQSRSESQ